MEDAIETANEIASEHLEILTKKNPFDIMTRIRNAGAIFLGEYASEPLGDYFRGAEPHPSYKRDGQVFLPSLRGTIL